MYICRDSTDHMDQWDPGGSAQVCVVQVDEWGPCGLVKSYAV